MNKDENSGFFPTTDWQAIQNLPAKDLAQRKQFFADFLEAYQPALLSFLTRAMKLDQDEAEEVAQDFVLEKVLSEKVFNYANQQVRFRDLIRTFLKRFYITKLRKRKPITGFEEHLDSTGNLEGIDFEFDQPWAATVFHSAITKFKEQSAKRNEPFWELFEARILTQPPMPYSQIIDKFGLETPELASNRLMTAKRIFNRIIEELLEKQALADDPSDSQIRDIQELKRHLADSDIFRLVRDATQDSYADVDESIGVSVFNNSESASTLLNERETFTVEEDLSEIACHLFDLSIANVIGESEIPLDDTPATDSVALGSLLDFVRSQHVSFEMIFTLKSIFNTKAKDLTSCTPSKINVMMTFVCIAKTLVHYPDKFIDVTGMRIERAKAGLEFFQKQNWIPQPAADVFSQALESTNEKDFD